MTEGFDYDFEHDSVDCSYKDCETTMADRDELKPANSGSSAFDISDDGTLASRLAEEAKRENLSAAAAKVLSDLALGLKSETTEQIFKVDKCEYKGPIAKDGLITKDSLVSSNSGAWSQDFASTNESRSPTAASLLGSNLDQTQNFQAGLPTITENSTKNTFGGTLFGPKEADSAGYREIGDKEKCLARADSTAKNSNLAADICSSSMKIVSSREDEGSHQEHTTQIKPVELADRLRIFYRQHMPVRVIDADKIASQFAGEEDALNAMLRLKYGEDLSQITIDTKDLDKLACAPSSDATKHCADIGTPSGPPEALRQATGGSVPAKRESTTDRLLAQELAAARRQEADLLWEAHQASMAQLNQMTPQQRAHAREQLTSSLDPKMLALLHKRAGRRRSNLLAGPSPEVALATRAAVAKEMSEEDESGDEGGDEGGLSNATGREMLPPEWLQGPDDG